MTGEPNDSTGQRRGKKETYKQLLKFAGFGVLGFSVEAAMLAFLTHGAGINPYVARFPAWFAKIGVTWPLNRKLTFRRERSPNPFRLFAKYAGSQATGAISNFAVYAGVLVVWKDIPTPVLALFIGALLGFAINFTLSKIWVFSKGRKSDN